MLKTKIIAAAVASVCIASSFGALGAFADEIQTPEISASEASPETSAPASSEENEDALITSGVKAAPGTPVVTSSTVTSNGLEVKWNSVPNAEGYVLYRHIPSAGNAKYKYFYVGKDATSFTWDDYASYKNDYHYYILSFVKDGDKSVLSSANDFTANIMASPVTPSAAAPAKTSITKTTKTHEAVRVNWNKADGADGYEVYIYKNGAWLLADTTADLTSRISGLSANTTYTFCVRSFKKTSGGNLFSEFSSNVAVTTKSKPAVNTNPTAPVKTAITKTSRTDNAVRVTWNKVANADGYEVYVYKNGSWVLGATTSDGTARISGLSASTNYSFCVRGYANSANGKVYGTFSDNVSVTTKPKKTPTVTVTAPGRTEITKTSKTATAVRVNWGRLADADGYQVQVLKNGEWTVAADTKDTTARVANLSPATNYYFCVRGYKNSANGKVFGPFSSNVFVTTKNKTTTTNPNPAVTPAKTTITGFSKTTNAVRVNWNKVAYADGYEVYIYKNGAWALAATTSDSTARIGGLSPNTKYTFTVRGYSNSSSGKRFAPFADNAATFTKKK